MTARPPLAPAAPPRPPAGGPGAVPRPLLFAAVGLLVLPLVGHGCHRDEHDFEPSVTLPDRPPQPPASP